VKIAAFVLAAWGAILSTLLAADSLLRKLRKVKVKVSGSGSAPSDLRGRDAFLGVQCVNTGSRPVRIEYAMIRWANGRPSMNFMDGGSLPAKLEPEEHVDLRLILTAAKSDPFAVVVGYGDQKVITHHIDASMREQIRWTIDEVDEQNSRHNETRWRVPADGVDYI
jgi:hypothetical protein